MDSHGKPVYYLHNVLRDILFYLKVQGQHLSSVCSHSILVVWLVTKLLMPLFPLFRDNI